MSNTGIKFDKTINLGQVVSILALLCAGIAAFFRMEGRVDINASQITHNKEQIAEVEDDAREEKQERKEDRKEIISMLDKMLSAIQAKQDKEGYPFLKN